MKKIFYLVITVVVLAIIILSLIMCRDDNNNSFTVTFETGDGSNVDAIKVKNGTLIKDAIVDVTNPIRAEHTFDEWLLDGAALTDQKVTKNITLTAKWVLGIYIKTSEDLANISNNLSANFILANDIALTDEWTPIGNTLTPFTGVLDGNGFTISNLIIADNCNYSDIGLFGVVSENAGIKNLNLADIDIKIPHNISDIHIGGLVGSVLKGNTASFGISNVSVTGNITMVASSSNSYIGSLIGKVDSEVTTSIIESENSADISVTGFSVAGVTLAAGGLIGHADTDSRVTITDTKNLGDVTVNSPSNQYNRIGGLVGNGNTVIITNFVNEGDILVNTLNTAFAKNIIVAGLIGRVAVMATINDSKNFGVVTATHALDSKMDIAAGGFIGHAGNDVMISNSTNHSVIDGKNFASDGYTAIGGLIGVTGFIENSTGIDVFITKSQNLGDISGLALTFPEVDGFIGWVSESELAPIISSDSSNTGIIRFNGLTAVEHANNFKRDYQSALELDIDNLVLENEPIVNDALNAYNSLHPVIQTLLNVELILLNSLSQELNRLQTVATFKTEHADALALEIESAEASSLPIVNAALAALESLDLTSQADLSSEFDKLTLLFEVITFRYDHADALALKTESAIPADRPIVEAALRDLESLSSTVKEYLSYEQILLDSLFESLKGVEIWTIEDLKSISNNLSGHFVLCNDLDLTGEDWTPIGTTDNPFTGTLDGYNHTISGLTITNNQSTIGLFGVVSSRNVIIQNLNLKAVDINVIANDEQNLFVGGLIGKSIEGTNTSIEIHSVFVTGTINVTVAPYARLYVGGLVGSTHRPDTIKIVDSKNSANITTSATSENISNDIFAGGLVGQVGHVIIINSKNHGDINSSYIKVNNIGGLVGLVLGTANVKDSKNFGDITSTNSKTNNNKFGGLFGKSQRAGVNSEHINVTNFENTGHIYASGHQVFAGGLIGFRNSRSSSQTIITDSINSGNITADSKGTANGTAYAGGLMGQHDGYGYNYNNVKIHNFKNLGHIKGSTEGANDSKALAVGGLIGEDIGYSAHYSITVDRFENDGSIEACSTSGGAIVGGIFGIAETRNIKVTNSTNKGSISATGSSSSIIAGGLIGRTNISSDKYFTITLTNSTNHGNIEVTTTSENVTTNVNGLIGLTNRDVATLNITNSSNDGIITINGDVVFPQREELLDYLQPALFASEILRSSPYYF